MASTDESYRILVLKCQFSYQISFVTEEFDRRYRRPDVHILLWTPVDSAAADHDAPPAVIADTLHVSQREAVRQYTSEMIFDDVFTAANGAMYEHRAADEIYL